VSREQLARRQAALIAALHGTGPVPDGFDERLVRAAADALARKRAGAVAMHWPQLRHEFGPKWTDEFRRWAVGRVGHGALRDGWDFARTYVDRLGEGARLELAEREVVWRYDGVRPPRRRWAPALRRVGRTVLVQIGGRVLRLGRARV